MSPNRSEIIRAYRMVIGDEVTELRALNAVVGTDRWAGTFSGYFNDAEKFADAVCSIRSATGIYFIPNPVDPALLARSDNRIKRAGRGMTTGDDNIIRRKWLLIDCDAIRPAGISATDAEHEAAIARCGDIWLFCHDELGWDDPIEADSGNGGHLLYRINLQVMDNDFCKNALAILSKRFSDNAVKVDTQVFNPARIWKAYGTPACKGDSTVDRPHRLSRILRAPREISGVMEEYTHV